MTADLAAFLLACLKADKQVEMHAPTATTYQRAFRLADIAAKKTIVELHQRRPRANRSSRYQHPAGRMA